MLLTGDASNGHRIIGSPPTHKLAPYSEFVSRTAYRTRALFIQIRDWKGPRRLQGPS